MVPFVRLLLFTIFLGIHQLVVAQNPIIQTIYTADPAPLVYKDTLFLYTGHDEDRSTWFVMKDWHVYATVDMVNWIDRGTPLALTTFSWAKKDAWAGQCIFREGKFYWYVPVNKADGSGMAIGVAVSNSPTGPFTDPIDKPLVYSGNGDIDPSAFIDDDGQAYLYWGNPYLKYVKLNKDMVSFSGNVINEPLNKEGFSVRYKDADKRPSAYEEGPWIYRRKNLYYLLYAAGGVPEHIAYSTSKTARGPWQYRDTVMTIIKNGGAFTNHPGVVDYKGKSYFFYHNAGLQGGGGFNRSVAVEEFVYNPDGTIPRIQNTQAGVKQIQTLDPYQQIQAETIAWEVGIETTSETGIGTYVTEISNGAYIKVRGIDLGHGPKSFEARVKGSLREASIELHLDSLKGPLLTTLIVQPAVNPHTWIIELGKIAKKSAGIHDLFLVFKGDGNDLFDFDWWKMNK